MASKITTPPATPSTENPWSEANTLLLKQRGYTNFKKIGYGNFATVHRADKTDLRNNSTTPVAIKFINLASKSAHYRDKLFPREYQASRKLKHRNIVPVREIIVDDNKCWIVMELEKSDLLQTLDKVGKIDEAQGRVWSLQIMKALKFMHVKRWTHRDLKVENVLIGYDNRALLSDFGFSRQQAEDTLSQTHLGSMQYSAPEVLEIKKGTKGEHYDAFKADIWGLGIVIFVMHVGFLPVKGETKDEIRSQQDKIHKLLDVLPDDLKLSDNLTDLLKKLLAIDPDQRISLDDAMNHPWFKEATPVKGSRSNTGPVLASSSPAESIVIDKDAKRPQLRVSGYKRSVVEVPVVEPQPPVRHRSSRGSRRRSITLVVMTLLFVIAILLLTIICVIMFI